MRLALHGLVYSMGLNCVIAQSTYKIMGSVLDSKTMTPVSGAVVLLTGTLHGTLTGDEGVFELTSVYPENYTLIVSAEGYSVYQEAIEVEHNLEMKILLALRPHELPDPSLFVNPRGGWATRMYRGMLPRRINAIENQYTLYESKLSSKSFYLDGIRLLDASILRSLIVELDDSEVIPSPYNLGLGMEASIQFKTPQDPSSEAELVYDSRTRRVHSAMTYHHTWSRGFGGIRGIYEEAGNYSDGNGAFQQAGIRSGNIAGRAGIRIGANHHLSGSGGWLQDTRRTVEKIRHRVGIAHYRFEKETGLLRGVFANAAIQQLDHDEHKEQQSASIAIILLPRQNLRLNMGADIHRYSESAGSNFLSQKEHDEISMESSVFVAGLHQISRLIIEGKLRIEPDNGYWGGMTFIAWQLSRTWQAIAGVGRTQFGRGVVRQADMGVRWNGFQNSAEIMTFTRDAESSRLYGATTLLRGSWWWMATYITFSDTSVPVSEISMSTWAKAHATVKGPLSLFSLGAELYGTFSDSTSWISADIWIKTMEIGSVSFQMGVHNLLDTTYRYPLSMYAEPGRSLQIALQYQRQ